MGAAHLAFLNDLQGQYAGLFRARRFENDESQDGPMRLRGGAPEHHVACQCGIKWEREGDFWPSYNIAPRQRAPILRRDASTGGAMIETMQWGLVPHWTKHPPSGPLNTINARSEALIDPSSGGMWHALKGYKRCVVPAQGYFEWQKKGSSKVANFARLPLPEGGEACDPPILFFAGLWDTVTYVDPVPSKFVPGPDDDREPYPTGNPIPLTTFTILTTVPAADIAWLHDRMPCILTSEEDVARWLDLGVEPQGWKEGKGGTADLLVSYPGITAFPVVPEVGKIGKSDVSYILPVAERKDGIKSFFAKQSPKKVAPAGQPPPKPISKAELMGDVKGEVKGEVKAELVGDVKAEVKDEDDRDIKPKAEDEAMPQVKEELHDQAKPEPEPEPISIPSEIIDVDAEPPQKRKRQPDRRGRQTKVMRPTPDKSGQKSITSFFKSPKK
ncbi:hypothetical protein CcaverHIS631_0110200 [Cutaneotrichosporon cavernicola]|nr:hypothetical protein CcaverHIS631_0110200 [Cutaneotrichosporon cavernicola]